MREKEKERYKKRHRSKQSGLLSSKSKMLYMVDKQAAKQVDRQSGRQANSGKRPVDGNDYINLQVLAPCKCSVEFVFRGKRIM